MDIDLLSKIIAELIVENGSVNLPGVGTFVKEEVPAVISDRGYTINPPYSRLAFVSSQVSDNLIVNSYAAKEGISEDDAAKVLDSFLTGLREVLVAERFVLFPGLGKLRATLENEFFFVSDDNPNLFPECFGLEPVSIGVRDFKDEESAAVKPAPVSLADIAPAEPEVSETPAAESEPGSAAEPSPAVNEVASAPANAPESPANAPESTTSKKPKRKSAWKVLGTIVLVLVTVTVVLAGGFMLLLNYAPDILDRILFPNPADLEIVHQIDNLLQ